MKRNFNKKKINLWPNSIITKYFIIIIFFLIFCLFLYNDLNSNNRLYKFVQNISEKFSYQFLNLELNSLNKVDKSEVLKIVDKYYNQSIFLIPLEEISLAINELQWVKTVYISSNFKNKLNIEIIEYLPVGLLSYNDQLFYFSEEGKIISNFKGMKNEKLIIFHGKQVLTQANNLLLKLDKIESLNMSIVKEAYYINERRWDLKLYNDIVLNLSEKNIEDSIKNYIILIQNFNYSETQLIKNIDLRNNEKAIINFK